MRILIIACLFMNFLTIPVVCAQDDPEERDPPEVAIGQRLFRDTRFAQFVSAKTNHDVNAPLSSGDPVMSYTATLNGKIANPYSGGGINCAACHFVDELVETRGGGSRAYGDFTRRSPVPARGDGKTTTVRNAPAFVNSTLHRNNEFFLHADGEFTSTVDLVKGTITGRNFGWFPNERGRAITHIAQVLRDDNGNDALGREYGGSYTRILKGTDPAIPEEFRLPPEYCINITTASDQEIFDAMARLVAAYVDSIVFENTSPYDRFLTLNGLPDQPATGENPLDYARRLGAAVEQLSSPRYVTPADGTFTLHAQEFVFGPKELQGMKIFFRENTAEDSKPLQSVGNCIACHTPPVFTDFSFHNTGTAQEEYDSVHGPGAFARLEIPGLDKRNRQPDEFLPVTANHPHAREPFRAIPDPLHPGLTDLGVWNIFANPDFPKAQATLQNEICSRQRKENPAADCSLQALLPKTIALFKTVGLRDLGHTTPYFHNGRIDTIEGVILAYINSSALATRGLLRNADPAISHIQIQARDVEALSAFLRSLNEDYD